MGVVPSPAPQSRISVVEPSWKPDKLGDKWDWIIGIGIIVVVVIGIVCLVYGSEVERANRCVRVQPPDVLGGHIVTGGGFFTSETKYYLSYRGKRKMSGDACKARRRVTEGEYERHMYGKDE